MDDEVEIIYNKIIEKLNEEVKQYSYYWLYTENRFIKYGKAYKKDNLSLQMMWNKNKNWISDLNHI